MSKMRANLFSVDEIFIVPPHRSVRVVVSRHKSQTYVSIQDLVFAGDWNGDGFQSRKWEHRAGSSFGCGTADPYRIAEKYWDEEYFKGIRPQ